MRALILILWALAASAAFAQTPNPDRAFESDNGFFISSGSDSLIWIGGGSVDPRIAPGVQAPINSQYYQTNGDSYYKTGIGATDWELQGLGSAVVTQTMSFGKAGNASANSYLDRAGNVPSNIAGETVVVSSGSIRVVACGQEDIDTYSAEVYEHEGDFINPVLKYTLTVTAARSGIATGLNITVTQGKQVAFKVLNAVKNIGCTIGLKGLSL